MASRGEPETDLQIMAVLLARKALGARALVHSVPNDGKRTRAFAGVLKAMGFVSGAADLCVVWGGRIHYLEFKAPKRKGKAAGVQTDNQIEFESLARAAGAEYAVVRSLDDVFFELERWGAPLRTTWRDGRMVRYPLAAAS